LLHLSRHLRPPRGELFVEFLGELRHAVTVPRFTLPRKISPSEAGCILGKHPLPCTLPQH
jgi:hypothetical protein